MTPTYAPRRKEDSLVAEVLRQPAPCDTCDLATSCRAKNLACRDYLAYVKNGKIRKTLRRPTRKQYRKIFKHEDRTDARTYIQT